MSRLSCLLLLIASLGAPIGAAHAQTASGAPNGQALPAGSATPDAERRADTKYGHRKYEKTNEALVDIGRGFVLPNEYNPKCLLNKDAAVALNQLLDAAEIDPELTNANIKLRGVSCYRPPDDQAKLFCSAARKKPCVPEKKRSKSVAPGGYSEHATGYALDFGTRPLATLCPKDVFQCFGATVAGNWLRLNAPNYGFELSFPMLNIQGVCYEPWHWRWVGRNDTENGAALARQTFAIAREKNEADPAIDDSRVRPKAASADPDCK